jgi:cell pole-organizing protein PopZ
MRQEGEPSVEEILESIKKVIARDNRAEAAEQRRHRETASQPEDDDMANEDDLADEDGEVFDLAAEAELDEELEAETELKIEDEDKAMADSNDQAPLVTEDARMSMQDSLTALAMLAEPGARPQIVRSGETSLEGMVRELLRPALADWLEKNLPAIVERLVAAEIARIAGKRG